MSKSNVDDIMSTEAVKARAARCEKKELCFISGEPIGNASVIIDHSVVGPVRVKAYFVRK